MVSPLSLLALLSVTRAPASAFNKQLRVIAGIDDIHSKYSYVVAWKMAVVFERKICTGSVIKPNWVLSGAHCCPDCAKIVTHLYMQWGDMSLSLSDTDTKSVVLKIINHPNYSNFRNDIALVYVKTITMHHYGTLSAIDFRALIGFAVEYAGYGMTYNPFDRKVKDKKKKNELDVTRPLQIGEASITSCRGWDRNDEVLCLQPKCSSKQMISLGDSGGPMFLGNKIIGVAESIGAIGKYLASNVFIYTPVSPYISWIQKTIDTHSDH
ncbi:serine protease SP24D-like [Anticarsia gemmatalis]|uniref:serine protease SP24D-like n=1 Tax=Anticarsia gemmatalis TaxID=129554 RepID=UPI003F76A1D9